MPRYRNIRNSINYTRNEDTMSDTSSDSSYDPEEDDDYLQLMILMKMKRVQNVKKVKLQILKNQTMTMIMTTL